MKNRKQAYHIETEKGLINDPNGLSYFKGKYYVFFQWNPNATDHSYKVWGKTTSQDLIHWSEPVIALQASESYDKDGTYSGSAVSDGETLSLYYTGNVKVNGVRYPEQCLAQSEDGIHFTIEDDHEEDEMYLSRDRIQESFEYKFMDLASQVMGYSKGLHLDTDEDRRHYYSLLENTFEKIHKLENNWKEFCALIKCNINLKIEDYLYDEDSLEVDDVDVFN